MRIPLHSSHVYLEHPASPPKKCRVKRTAGNSARRTADKPSSPRLWFMNQWNTSPTITIVCLPPTKFWDTLLHQARKNQLMFRWTYVYWNSSRSGYMARNLQSRAGRIWHKILWFSWNFSKTRKMDWEIYDGPEPAALWLKYGGNAGKLSGKRRKQTSTCSIGRNQSSRLIIIWVLCDYTAFLNFRRVQVGRSCFFGKA